MSKNDPLAFWKKYELVRSTNNYEPDVVVPKVCRYCKKDESETKFSMKAHVIPELLGQNNLLAPDECDTCNQKFSAYESHLSKFFMPYLTMNGVKGKKGIPQFQSRTIDSDENTRTIIKATDNKREILFANLNDYIIDEENKTMTVIFRKPPHRPRWVLKALTKIGLSLISSESFTEYKNVSNWLLNRPTNVQFFPLLIINILTYKKVKEPFADLYKAKRILFSKSFVPEYTVIAGFGNVILQIFLPTSQNTVYKKAEGKTASLDLFPDFILDDLTRKESGNISLMDLGSNETIAYDQSLSFTFQEAELNIQQQIASV